MEIEGSGGWDRSYVLVAFAAAESEESCIVPDKGNSLRWVARLRAEVARLNPNERSV
jgi:hypothetical protein